jgi:hypothetical protein
MKKEDRSFEFENPPKNEVASRIRWARPDLRDLDCVASPVLISKIDATTMGDQFEILNRKLTLDDPDIWVIGRED